MKTKFALLIALLLTCSIVFPARADGIIIPDPPICDPMPCPGPIPMEQLVVRYHHVTVTIQDQVAVTHVDQVFYNPNDWQIEGTYIFPIPVDAVVTNFVLWVDGKPIEGQVLEANQARQTYEDIVRRMRDPALLEYIGRDAVQARIFPIPPQGERRVELEYSQALTAENGLVRYIYPLSTEKFSAQPIESVTISVDIQSSSVPIRAVYSPSHDVAVSRESDTHVIAGYEASNILPDTDFALYYSLGETEAFHVLSYRDPFDASDPDGFFLVLLAPRIATTTLVIPKDVLLVLDRSGSMEGEKFQQAQEALRYILGHLNAGDRFNIITFSTGTETYATGLRPASEANEAISWLGSLSAEGSTDINRALLEAAAMTDKERPIYLIFLTDGLPTEGIVDSQQILDNFAAAAPDNLRLFAFGVGYDVDTFLLDSLAQAHHGTSNYVLPGEPLDEAVSAFYAKISTPVLTDLGLDFGGISTYDIYPDPLPDLFVGSQIVAVGRYRDGGTTDVTLTGKFNNETQTFVFSDQVFESQSKADSAQASIPRLWATRKIGYLLNKIRLNGPDQETIDQIVKLSIRYGIVTPYTSYLVTEEMPLGAAEQERIAGEQYNQMQAQPTQAPSGAGAVQKAYDEGVMAGAGSASAPPAEAANIIKIVGSRTFVLSDNIWTDTAFDPDTMQTVKVSFLSDDYFALTVSDPDLAAAFALGERVIALTGSVAYEVVPSDEPVEPIDVPAQTEPTAYPAPNTSAPTPTSAAYPVVEPTSTPASTPCASALLPFLLAPLCVLALRKSSQR
jgi:Ca-activated chloride channel family protein